MDGASTLRESVLFRIHGRVQGVGYRWWTRREASRLGLPGTVRNLPDGTVEVVARGTPDELDRLEAALLRGPVLSMVERVVRSPGELPDDISDFEIAD